MNKFEILEGDCMELIKQQPDNSIDLVVTSPPYTDIINYGKEVSIKKPEEYVDWLLPLFIEIYRVLKPTGSFILNINDNCSNGLRNTYIYELIYRSGKETPLKLYDTYIWHKRNGIPNGGKKRFRNLTEFIFHFVKDRKQMKFYMDRVLEEPNISTLPERRRGKRKRVMYANNDRTHRIDYYEDNITDRSNEKIRPDNVFRFSTAVSVGQKR